MSSLTYKLKSKCPECSSKTSFFGTHKISYLHVWIEFCKDCGWFNFVARPRGQEMLRLQIHGVNASDEELEIINKILSKSEEKTEGNWKELGEN